jgi:hypothetical protein
LTKSAEVDSIAFRSFGWGEEAALTSVGGGAASAFCFCGFGWVEVTALTKLGVGGPTISEGCGETEAIVLTNLGAGVGAAGTRSGECEAGTFASFGEGAGLTSAVADEGNTLWDEVFSKAPLLGLGLPVGACKPLFGTEPE